MKALVVFFLIIFGILTLKHAFPDHCNVLLGDTLMVGLLIIILGLVIALYTINIFPRRQETKGKKAPVTDLKENFTHIIALIITLPLIVVTCVLLVDGNHSEELTFISGLLGVIIGYYFGQRGVENAESKWAIAMKEKDDAVSESTKAVQGQKKERKEMADSIEKYAMDVNRASLHPSKERAWVKFKEQIKKENKEFKGVENIDKYLPWKEPEGGWNEKEKMIITQFEEEWELFGEKQAAHLGGGN